MMPKEFREWHQVWAACPDDDNAFADAAWRVLQAKIEQLEQPPFDSSEAWADAIKWAAFWLALGAVCTAAVLKLA